jgi:hypothetical protein
VISAVARLRPLAPALLVVTDPYLQRVVVRHEGIVSLRRSSSHKDFLVEGAYEVDAESLDA